MGRFRIRIIEYGKQEPLLKLNNLLCCAAPFVLPYREVRCCKSLILLMHKLQTWFNVRILRGPLVKSLVFASSFLNPVVGGAEAWIKTTATTTARTRAA